jgi:uncharacterized protein (TIGR03083 family)
MDVQKASEIPGPTHAESSRLAQTEYERVLALLETLEGDDWTQPTYCTEWNVRDMTAHLAGSVTASTSFAQFRHYYVSNPYLKLHDEPADAANRLQVEERAGLPADVVIAEFRQNGPIAIRKRVRLPWLVRQLPTPLGPTIGMRTMGYLMDVIFPRDEWMHRYDICAATGKEMVETPEHDGRLIALVVWDIARKLKEALRDRTVLLRLSGEAGGDYLFGAQAEPDCTIETDVFSFSLLASGRITVDEMKGLAGVSGDAAVADWFLHNMEVPY